MSRVAAALRREGWGPALLMAGLLLFFAAALVYPVWLTIRGGISGRSGGFTVYHVGEVFADPVLRRGLANALGIAAVTTVLSALIGVPLAAASARYEFPGRKVLGGLVLAPLVLPPFVGAIGLYHLLGRFGAANAILHQVGLVGPEGIDFLGRGGFWAIAAVEALHLYPIIYLNMVAALSRLDPALEEAAENLGAGWWRRFAGIILPQARPGFFAGATIVFVWSLTELGTPLMFDFPDVTPVQIYSGIREMRVSARPFALTAVLLAAAAVSYGLGRLAVGRRTVGLDPRGARPPQRRPAGIAAGVVLAGAFGFVTVLALMPHVSVILVSVSATGQWYQSVLPRSFTLAHYAAAVDHPLAVGSIRNSLVYASAAAALDLVLGFAIAWLVVRTRLPGRRVLDSLAMLPLAVPGLVMAFGYVAVTLRWPFRAGDPLAGVADVLGADPNPVLLLIVAYGVRRLPYVVRAAEAGLEQAPTALEEAAVNLGAGRLRVICTVLIPLAGAGLAAGALLAFSFAMLEVSDSLVLAQRAEHFPITKAIFVLFERLGDGQYIASALGVWAMALLAVTLVGTTALLGQRLGAVFRG